MTYDGCQGKKGPVLTEKLCPECGESIEMSSTDLCAVCDSCGFTVYNDLMSCVFNCPHARECIGEEQFSKLAEVKAHWTEKMRELSDDDEW